MLIFITSAIGYLIESKIYKVYNSTNINEEPR